MTNYKTEQRKLIMEFLINNENNFVSAEEMSDYLKNKNEEVGLTTIYRFLNLLEKNNNVRVELRNHTKYYQYVPQDSNHHLFLKCKNCGKSINLDCEEVENVNLHIKQEHNFNLDYNTIMYGTCGKCSKQ